MLAGIQQFRFGTSPGGLIIVAPPSPRRQAHQDGFGTAIGFKAKERTPVVYQVEFHITAPTDLLPFLLVLTIGRVHTALDDGHIGWEECIPVRLLEGKKLFRIGIIRRPQMIIEYTPDAAHLTPAMFVNEIFVAPFFEPRIIVGAKGIHGRFKALMKMPGILFKKIVGCQIRATAEPAVAYVSRLIVKLEIPPVGMRRGNIRVQRMDHEGKPAGKPFVALDLQLCPHSLGDPAPYDAGVDATLFENAAIRDDPGPSAAA